MRLPVALLLSGMTAIAQMVVNPYLVQPAIATALITESFDTGSGYDDGADWNENNNPDEDYATSPAPLMGSESLYFAGGSSQYTYNTFTGSGSAYLYCRFHLLNSGVNRGVNFNFEDSSGNDLGFMQIKTNTAGTFTLRAANGTVNAADVSTYSFGTTYHLWVDYTKGTGADGITRVYLNTSGTKPSVTSQVTNGDATADAARIKLAVLTDQKMIVDTVLVRTSGTFGDNPWP